MPDLPGKFGGLFKKTLFCVDVVLWVVNAGTLQKQGYPAPLLEQEMIYSYQSSPLVFWGRRVGVCKRRPIVTPPPPPPVLLGTSKIQQLL